jgi:hypothetical protein
MGLRELSCWEEYKEILKICFAGIANGVIRTDEEFAICQAEVFAAYVWCLLSKEGGIARGPLTFGFLLWMAGTAMAPEPPVPPPPGSPVPEWTQCCCFAVSTEVCKKKNWEGSPGMGFIIYGRYLANPHGTSRQIGCDTYCRQLDLGYIGGYQGLCSLEGIEAHARHILPGGK